MDRKRFIIVPKCQTHSSQNPNEILDTKLRTRKCYVWCCSTSCNTRQIFPLHTGNQMQFVAGISCGFIKSVRSETLLQFFPRIKHQQPFTAAVIQVAVTAAPALSPWAQPSAKTAPTPARGELSSPCPAGMSPNQCANCYPQLVITYVLMSGIGTFLPWLPKGF